MPLTFSSLRLCALTVIICMCITHGYSQELKNINTGAVVKNAKVSYDGSKMVFMANYFGSFKPYISEFNSDSSQWTKPVQIFEGDVISGFK